MATFKFMLLLALACALLGLLALPLDEALSMFFMQGFVLSLLGAAPLTLAEMARGVARGWRFFMTGRED